MNKFIKENLPFILAIVLYVLIYFLRLQQVGTVNKKFTTDTGSGLFTNLRSDLDARIAQFLPSPQAELLSGILIGEQKDLPAHFKLALRDTSTLHIVVVSGQNLTMLAGVFLILAGVIPRKLAISASLLAIIFYTLLTGAQVPVLRAAIMAGASFIAVLVGRQKDGLWVLFVSGGLMLLINPLWIGNLSFQLSFLATFGVVAIAPIILRRLKFLPEILSQDLAVTLSAQLMVTPIIAGSFHQFSIVSVFTNLLVGWTVPFVMILGTIMLAFSYIFSPFAQLVAILTNALLTYFVYMVEFFASLPFAWIYVGNMSWLFWIGYYLIMAGVISALNKYNAKDQISNVKV